MNVALLSGNFWEKKGGISTTLKNLYEKLTALDIKIYLFDNSISKCSGYKIIYTRESFKKLLKQDIRFFIFLILLFIRILGINGLKLGEKLKLALFYCFYPVDLVNRVKSLKYLILYFKKFKVDVIFCISSSFLLIYGFILSKFFRKPLITLAHGEDFIKRYPNNINSMIFQNIEKVIVSNKIMRDLFLKIHAINDKKIDVVFRGVNIDQIYVDESKVELRKKFNFSVEDFIIITVSRIHPRKGIDTVIEALKLIYDENLEMRIKYVIIGEGEEKRDLENLVRKLNLEQHVRFLGGINDKLRNQYYKLSDLFVLVPYIKKNSIEGFGIVFIEASYFKLPVIGARTGGVRIAVEDGKTGVLINSGDALSLKKQILRIMMDQSYSRELGENGHKRVLKEVNWDKNALIYKRLIENVAKNFYYK
ncbi:MAG: glycosyltransferase family 4 protein [Promethearchaeota archaeon]